MTKDKGVYVQMLAKCMGGTEDPRLHRGVRVGGGEVEGEGGDGTALHLFQQVFIYTHTFLLLSVYFYEIHFEFS